LDDEALDNENLYSNKYIKLGKFGRTSLVEMKTTRIGVTEADWLDDSPNGLTPVETIHLQSQVIQKGSRWKAIVEEQKQKILADRSKNILSKSSKTMLDPDENNIKIIDQSYLQRNFKAKIVADNKLVDDTVQAFFLNTKQERAFRIIANYASEPKSSQLKMYLDGMSGTGKSQVIKALMHFFKQRNELYCIVVLGPTGSSAALINGSTYHSFLGINHSENSANKIAQLQARLEGVVYIFIDEVSMLSCNDLYRISAQLAKAQGLSCPPPVSAGFKCWILVTGFHLNPEESSIIQSNFSILYIVWYRVLFC